MCSSDLLKSARLSLLLIDTILGLLRNNHNNEVYQADEPPVFLNTRNDKNLEPANWNGIRERNDSFFVSALR